MNKKSLSVIIPLFNEFENLNKLFNDLLFLNKEFSKNDFEVEFIIINDCSTDNSEEGIIFNINKYPNLQIKYIKNILNIGFARSLVLGIDKSTSQYLMCLPGDAEVNVQSLSSLNIAPYDLVVYERENLSTRPAIRIFLSYAYRIIISIIFGHKIIDTNGIFIVNRDILKRFKIQADSFFINAEVIIKSMLYTEKIDLQKFNLSLKPTYKSTSLNWHQLFSVSKGVYKLFIFRWIHMLRVRDDR